MRCPYRKKVKVYPDGLGSVSVVEFMECVKEECPFWGAIVFSADEYKWKYGCRKVENECS